MSKGHPEDQRLVITRQAIDAMSYRRFNPDPANRTRYVSFDGAETPSRNALLNRWMANMPRGSSIVIATDRTYEARPLNDTIQSLRAQHPSLTFTRQEPHGRFYSWHEQLQATRETERVLAARAVKPRQSLGLDR